MTASEGGTVLIVDDDREVVRTYRRYLEDTYTIREAYDGEDALETLDGDVDVVLLDRLMPGVSGGEVLDRIREREYDVRVAMVTAVDPDFDIVDMGFDDYITKPTTRSELRETIEELLTLDQHATDVREYHSLLVKAAALHEGKSTYELDENPAYAELKSRISDLEATLESEAERLTDDSRFVATLRAIDTSITREETDG
ncbi:response regulator [Haloplanus aerogenes]|uniref:HalX domain-containing protein n=1 Tax=Haloplanus aerogenes TaxID=660522 RepID=A0A3M0CWH4_9EURY|nr:response regulator [Haloplanus aerogenes]AZH25223.1 response regulator [Haloplanus aerogenes]RMB13548.1 HalX domain-containing protein [Haloplanus aerogenes]